MGDPRAAQRGPDTGGHGGHADIIQQVTLLLRENDVRALVTMGDVIDALESAFREWDAGRADNQPRRRVRGGVFLATMSAALPAEGLIGLKAYTAGAGGTRFWVHLYDAASGKARAVVEADYLGRLRTGAASGIATRYLARPQAAVLTLFGAGTQALTQVLAVAAVRPLREVRVVTRNPVRRDAFMAELRSAWNGAEVRPVDSPQEALGGADVVTTITSAAAPLFPGTWLEPGQHVNAAGSNWPTRRELDADAVAVASPLVADDVAAARVEAGDLLLAEAEGRLRWSDVRSLREVVAGRVARTDDQAVSLFKSVGLALEDVAAAALVLKRAEQQGVGERIPL